MSPTKSVIFLILLCAASVAMAGTGRTAGSACIPESASSSDLANAKVKSKGEMRWYGGSRKTIHCGIMNVTSATSEKFMVQDEHPTQDITCYIKSVLGNYNSTTGKWSIQSGGYVNSDKTSGTGVEKLSVTRPSYTNQTLNYYSYCSMPPKYSVGSAIYFIEHYY